MNNELLEKGIKKLGFGFMRLPDKVDAHEIDVEHTKRMVDHYMKSGYTYFDTAVPYSGQKSESTLKECLVDRYPRESFQIATKLTPSFINENYSIEQMFHDSLKNIGVDYVDFYLFHAMNKSRAVFFEEQNAWQFAQKMKAEGKIKHFGFSFHDKSEVLDEVLTAHPEVEFVQLQLNYADWDNDMIQSRKCYEIAMKYGKPVTIMEPVRGGMLSSLVPQAEEIFKDARPDDSISKWALRFVADLDNVIVVLSGMSTLEQVEENVKTFDTMEPLTDGDKEAIQKVVKILDSMPNIPCTDCKYCVKDCPAKINIPQFFRVMNIHYRHDGADVPPTNLRNFKFAINNGQSRPSACVKCRKCEKSCPQKIEIIKELATVANAYEPMLTK